MAIKGLEYIIDYKSLSSGTYEIDYHIDKEFFDMFPDGEIHDGDVDVHVLMKVSAAGLRFKFGFNGTLCVTCDRCLETFDMPIESEYEMVAKFGEESSNPMEADDYIVLSIRENEIDLRQHIYEYAVLSLPARRVHPDDEDGNSTCNPEMLEHFSVVEQDDDDNEFDFDFDDEDFDFGDDDFDDDNEEFDDDEDYEDDSEDSEESDEEEDSEFEGEEMETIADKLSRDPNWEKIKSLFYGNQKN